MLATTTPVVTVSSQDLRESLAGRSPRVPQSLESMASLSPPAKTFKIILNPLVGSRVVLYSTLTIWREEEPFAPWPFPATLKASERRAFPKRAKN